MARGVTHPVTKPNHATVSGSASHPQLFPPPAPGKPARQIITLLYGNFTFPAVCQRF